MAQFQLDKTLKHGEIKLKNYNEIENTLKTTLENYKQFQVSNQTYSEAKAKRAELNAFEKQLNRVRIDTKKEYLTPYETFEAQLKTLSTLVGETSLELDKQIKAIDEMEANAKRTDIEFYYSQLQMLIPLDKIYKKEWENKSYRIEKIYEEILEIKGKIDTDLAYITKEVANNDPLLKARIKATYLDTLDLIGSITKEQEKENEVSKLATEITDMDDLEKKEMEVVLTLNAHQWYALQTYCNKLGIKIRKKGN